MADSKRRAGARVKKLLKSSSYLPAVFQTEINKKWLDSTLDQMLSKSDLRQIDGYIGSRTGTVSTSYDVYVEPKYHTELRKKAQLQPAIVTKNADDTYNHVLTVDDIAHAINSNFNTYNYHAAYSSETYGFYPPIDIDKFVNYTNYYWIEELPTYTSVNNTDAAGTINVVDDARGKLTYSFVDDNNAVELQNSMIVKFEGSAYDTATTEIEYLVIGVGRYVELLPYRDQNGKYLYPVYTKTSTLLDGYWDTSSIIEISANPNNEYFLADPSSTPGDLISAYNSDANRLPVFDGFVFNGIDSNPTQFVESIFVQFDDSWNIDEEYKHRIYYTYKNTNGNVALILVVDAVEQPDGSILQTLVPQTNPNLQYKIENTIIKNGWSVSSWDSGPLVIKEHDYQVFNRRDPFRTGWSRNNHWVNLGTVEYLNSLFAFDGIDNSVAVTENQRAKRPIIEFIDSIELWDYAKFSGATRGNIWLGIVDFIIDPVDEYMPQLDTLTGDLYYDLSTVELNVDNRIIFSNINIHGNVYKDIYRIDPAGVLTLDEEVYENHCMYVLYSAQNTLSDYIRSDVYFTGTEFSLGQQRVKNNQMPLFRLFDDQGFALEDIAGSTFKGSRVFNYQLGTGTDDVILGFPLSYQDGPKGAEYKFENYILTETYFETFTDAINVTKSYRRILDGYYFFKRGSSFNHVYAKNDISAGAKEILSATVQSVDNDLTISVGYDSWRPAREIILHQTNNFVTATEIISNGVYTKKAEENVEVFYAPKNTAFKIHNHVVDNPVKLKTTAGYDIENPPPGVDMPDISVTRTDTGITVNIGNVTIDDKVIIEFQNSFDRMYVVIADDYDKLYHCVKINGTLLSSNEYTVESDYIVVPKELLSVGYIVDLEYYSNDSNNSTLNTSIPEVHTRNANNEVVTEFTITETLGHWKSIIEHVPGLEGNVFGKNNLYKLPVAYKTGGEILIHEDLSIMHDVHYNVNGLDMTAVLVEQGRDWDNFKTRFANQVRRLYKTKPYSKISDLVNDALASIVINKKGSGLYKNSNVLYGHTKASEEIIIQEGVNYAAGVDLKFTVHGDVNIRDHVYVYLADYEIDNTSAKERLLLKDVDYKIIGNVLTLLIEPVFGLNGLTPSLKIFYHSMDEESYVPPSMVKLGLSRGYQPNVRGNKLQLHDGCVIDLKENADLVDFSSSTFDPVNAALFDIEKRIWTGLVRLDNAYTTAQRQREYYKSVYDYFPTQHRGRWYTLKTINDYIYRSFKRWATAKNIETVGDPNYYDPSNPFTWNYSTIELGEHFSGNTLPGHWVGAYITIFGTFTPHNDPWHMLGYGFKPVWWDDHYSWTDPVKRAALIQALRFGIVSRPGLPVSQEIRYARYYWDWDNHCPVDTSGNIVRPDLVLGTPAPVNAAKAYEFGDWGPVEVEWRYSAEGYAATVDAIIKLNPTRAFTEFYQPGFVQRQNKNIASTTVNSRRIITPADYIMPGTTSNVVSNIIFNNPSDYFDTNGTIEYVDGDNTFGVTTVIAHDSKFSLIDDGNELRKIKSVGINNRGWGFDRPPVLKTTLDAVKLANTDIKIIMKEVEFVANGISQAQYNYIIRNQLSYDLSQNASTLDTRLAYKLEGFSNKNLINFYAETSASGPFAFGENDFTLTMYTGYPTEFDTASSIKIHKSEDGYTVSGISSNAQTFSYYEPDFNSDYSNISINGSVIKKYKKFKTQPTTIEYGQLFIKIQETHDFIRGYFKYLEMIGYTLETTNDTYAAEFVRWAITANDETDLVLNLGKTILYTPDHGFVAEYNTIDYNKNNVLDQTGHVIEATDLVITRTDDTVYIKVKSDEDLVIGSISSAVLDHEHAAIFENTTTLGVTVFDDVKNFTKNRLLFKGQITDGWNGCKKAPGYLVFDDGIVQNFDSSVNSIDDLYRTDVVDFNPAMQKLKDMTIGNTSREWLATLGLDKNTITEFYKGMIQEKGSNNVLTRIGRSLTTPNNIVTVTAREQYMFNYGYLGDTTRLNSTEFTLKKSTVTTEPQIIRFTNSTNNEVDTVVLSSNDKRFVNKGNNTFATITLEESDYKRNLVTAGEPILSEVTHTAIDMDDIANMFDISADYANIPTWDASNNTSYKIGDIVRYNGGLYKSIVDFTDLVETVTDVSVTGTITFPTINSETFALIDGVTVDFNRTTTNYLDINALGTIVNPTIATGDVLTIDGVSIVFSNTVEAEVVVTVPSFTASVTSPTLADTTGKFIIVNGNTVDFSDTPTKTTQQIVDRMNSVLPSAFVTTLVSDKIKITYNTSTPGDSLIISKLGTANIDIGYSTDVNTIVLPVTEIQQVPANLTLSQVVAQINAVGALPHITASTSSNAILITSTNGVLTLSGTARSKLGLSTSYTAEVQEVARNLTTIEIVNDINAADIPGVTAIIENNRIVLDSDNDILTIVESAFTVATGITPGIYASTVEEGLVNEWNPAQWENISHLDPALMSIWVADDSKYTVTSIGGVTTKFYGWNVFQVQNTNKLYTLSNDIDCGICAGTATRDGNDAEVTTNVAHGLVEGDYVMLLNTTTVPNIDGIHLVTKVKDSRTFYIDRFIEECGNAASVMTLRTRRFIDEEQRNTAYTYVDENGVIVWNPTVGEYAWLNYKNDGTRATYVVATVYDITSGEDYTSGRFAQLLADPAYTGWRTVRLQTTRPANTDIENIIIYDNTKNKTTAEFELYDPIRGIIPGVADREIDIRSNFDVAVYNTSNDDSYTTDENSAWGRAEVGRRWWDTSTVVYYDYHQGSLKYRAGRWGEMFGNSTIDVWEWTRSDVAPDDYIKAVEAGTEIFGKVATGVPYYKYDEQIDETYYYYTEIEEWNRSLGKYQTVYYFWVKQKDTIDSSNKMLTVREVASIIENPTDNGIPWFAVIDHDAIIMSNLAPYLNDESTVVQINRVPEGRQHSAWTLITQGADRIPDYWYQGLRMNYASQDTDESQIPYPTLHPYNRYGDDRAIGQRWFRDIGEARANGVTVLNDLFKDINIFEEYYIAWTTAVNENSFPLETWAWTAYENEYHDDAIDYSVEVGSIAELELLNTNEVTAAKIEIITETDQLDRSEFYRWIPEENSWIMARKNNATVKLSRRELSYINGWDTEAWDSVSWDNTHIADWWRTLVDVCRSSIFVGEHINKFNEFFFATVHYILSEFEQTNWIHKTSYIRVDIDESFDTTSRLFKTDTTDVTLGYINTVKPFHTKISDVKRTYTELEDVDLHVEDIMQTTTTINTFKFANEYIYDIYNANYAEDDEQELLYVLNAGMSTISIDSTIAIIDDENWYVAEVYRWQELTPGYSDYEYVLLVEGQDYSVVNGVIEFAYATDTPVVIKVILGISRDLWIDAGDWDTDPEPETTIDQGDFLQPENYNGTNDVNNVINSTQLKVRPQEYVTFKVQTNANGSTYDTTTKTFVYTIDNDGYEFVAALDDNNSTATLTEILVDTDTVELLDGNLLGTNGIALVGNEIIEFDRSADTLYIRKRSVYGTVTSMHSIGTQIIDITNMIMGVDVNNQLYFNEPGTSIIDGGNTIVAELINSLDAGIEL